ncbi:UbiA family prenyltransferase [Sulfuriroseicoccus oceanibius]|uniref:UbiA family prenyltransferase n=1 Tax=Sulfuriroseicoccus oceanibius TaxID=2707525 RepID=A0A6B3LC97_9BACT|nr:UbiA family prenyltransferase [Sulfuriroseicoccus oceanibius]QQL45730.1 UbiA family prenyltransferase [Sulfuriroseicoccus oceanibius]
MNAIVEHIKICRIEHWLKNIFIVFGHAVAVVVFFNLSLETSMVWKAALSLIPACLIASANYILNEILDAPFDALHPTKKLRGIPAGKAKVPILWAMMGGLIVGGFGLGWLWFENIGYTVALGLLLFSGLVYNIPPVRLKDRAFLDVIAESFNNPIRLWLGWYALLPPNEHALPPLSITMAWWFFGALLMTGKRYSEFRFIGNADLSGRYRKSFKTYTEQKLIVAMITYANLFCFCTGIAMATYPQLENLVLVFPMIVIAVICYFNHAMSEVGAKLEPEKLLQNKWIIVSTLATGVAAAWLLYAHQQGIFNAKDALHLMQPTWK